jgi:hypothetical protein
VPPGLRAQNAAVTIADRFAEEVRAAGRRGLDGPELLPERLTRAASAMLPVADASLSLLEGGDKRVPLGSSSPEAACAERLQFTVGDGPCMMAARLNEPVFASEDDLRRRWPQFTEQLFAETPFRAVVAFPLLQALAGQGAMDLYFRRSERIAQLDVFEAMAVGELITAALADAAVFSDWSAEVGPDWLHAPSARRRGRVWQAMGRLSLHLDVEGPAALDLMRTHALALGQTVDEVAADVLADRLDPQSMLGAR